MYSLRRNVPIFVCVCGAMKIGKNTITMSPGGTDVVRWSATQAATTLGDIGMDVTTGEPQAFIGGASRSILTTFSNQQSLFSFTHSSGAASTGALGFTPRFCIYTGAFENSAATSFTFSTGFATGTGSLARGACASTTNLTAGDDDAIAGISTSSWASTFNRDLDVTAFSSSGIELTWSGTINNHAGKLLVIG